MPEFNPEQLDEAARIYGFVGGMPDPVSIAPRQMELIERIARVLAERDAKDRKLTHEIEGASKVMLAGYEARLRTEALPPPGHPDRGLHFLPSWSTTRNVPVIEVWWGDRFVATITPPPPESEIVALSVVSKYLDHVVRDDNEPSAIAVSFDLDRQ